MPAQIHSIALEPGTTKSGGKVAVTVSYNAAYGARHLEFRCSNAKVNPRKLPVEQGAGQIAQTLTVTRTHGGAGPENLRVILGGDEQAAEITIS